MNTPSTGENRPKSAQTSPIDGSEGGNCPESADSSPAETARVIRLRPRLYRDLPVSVLLELEDIRRQLDAVCPRITEKSLRNLVCLAGGALDVAIENVRDGRSCSFMVDAITHRRAKNDD